MAKSIEQNIIKLLTDDSNQVISSFELNQIASLTYHEAQHSAGATTTDAITEIIEEIISKPKKCSTLALEKALAVTKHILLHGSEKALPSCRFLGKYAEDLKQNYNTVLIAQQQQGVSGFLLRIKGGDVDKGGPVREAAEQVIRLLSDTAFLRRERDRLADPNSLVPVGSDRVAFVTDEVRLHYLKKDIEEQRRIRVKSNLQKADGAFGSGYNAADGKQVVGAAHGLDEMMKAAKKEEMKFTDDGPVQFRAPREDLADPYMPTDFATQQQVDLLDFSNDSISVSKSQQPSIGVDLLEGDLLGSTSDDAVDLFGGTSASTNSADIFGTTTVSQTTDLFSSMTMSHDVMTGGVGIVQSGIGPMVSMSSASEKYSAFDSLAEPQPVQNNTSSLDDLASIPVPQQTFHVSNTGIRISAGVGARSPDEDDSENGFVMGGSFGAGLEPLGSAPAAPPPPPPPGGF